MNNFNLKYLENELIQNQITDKKTFLFLIMNWIVFGFTSFAIVTAQYGNPGVMVVLIILPILGVIPSFIANQNGDGKHFLVRLVMFHFAIGIRYFLSTIATVIVVDFLKTIFPDINLLEFLLALFAIFIIGGFYFHLFISINKISHQTKHDLTIK